MAVARVTSPLRRSLREAQFHMPMRNCIDEKSGFAGTGYVGAFGGTVAIAGEVVSVVDDCADAEAAVMAMAVATVKARMRYDKQNVLRKRRGATRALVLGGEPL